MNKVNELGKKLNPYKSIILLLISWALYYVMNGSYIATFVPFTLNLIACGMILWDGIGIIKTIYYMRDRLKAWVYWLALVVFGSMMVALGAGFVMNVATVTTSINIYEGAENKAPQQGVVYVTYNPDCEFCKKSHSNMLRAVSAYQRGHVEQVQVVNLKHKTKLADELNKRLDHYGSIVKFDNKGTLHETMYTMGTKDGEPVSNTASDIYDRIGKVATQ